MKDEIAIWDMMSKDHAMIEGLLNGLRVSFGKGPEEIKGAFERFQWKLELHFFTEERAIFTFLRDKGGETSALIDDILREHEVILGMLGDLGKDIAADNIVDISQFVARLVKHRTFEDEVLYPALDKELTNTQKEFIAKRIRTLP